MSRVEFIERLHAAKYDAHWADETCSEDAWNAYFDQFDAACERLSCTRGDLQDVLEGDFAKWMAENDLPRPPKR